MNFVQPIRDKKKIQDIKNELLRGSYRDFLLFVIGINTGLRISDILRLRTIDVRDRTHIVIQEQKTSKEKRAYINGNLKREIDFYIDRMGDGEYLFRSREGVNKPMTRVRAYQILNTAAKNVGIDEVGTHTLRKTFGYWHYQQNRDVALLQELFNHSAPSVTLKYIGINQDIMDKSIENFFL